MDIQKLQACAVAHEVGGIEGIVQRFLGQTACQLIPVCFTLSVQQCGGIVSDPVVDLLVGDVRDRVVHIRKRGIIGMLSVELIDLREAMLRRILEPERGYFLLLCTACTRGVSHDLCR